MAAHDILITLADASGRTVQQEIGDCDDTTAHYVTWKQWGDDSFFIARQNCYITDAKVTATGGTVVRYKLFMNGKDVGVELFNAGLGATTVGRVPSPIGMIPKDSQIRLQQI